MKIKNIQGLQIFDSRGNPTVRAFLSTDDGKTYSASVPSGASTGTHEAVELRDGDSKVFLGLGVSKAVENINSEINDSLKGAELDPKTIDGKLLELDGTENKARLGANAILAVSQAALRAAAGSSNKKLWQFINTYYFGGIEPNFPRLMVNVVNGGRHASWNFDIQEFMVVPNDNMPLNSTKIASEIFHSLGKTLAGRKLSTLVGDEGGYSPFLASNEEVLDIITEAAKNAGFENIKDYRFAIDAASTEFFKDGKYFFHKTGQTLTGEELTEYYQEIGQKYNILSFEDAFAEDDWENHVKFAAMAEQFHFQTVGDDLFVTNPKRIQKGIDMKAANAVLIKINQIGTVLETVEAIKMTKDAGWAAVISHRSGETEDSFIADLAYACGAEFIKTGSMSRSERLSKYNRLLEIEAGL